MKIALLNAHTSYSPGISCPIGETHYSEYVLSTEINKIASKILNDKKIDNFIVDGSNIQSYNNSLSYKAVFVNHEHADLAIETHFNASFNASLLQYSSGMEVLYHKERLECLEFAEIMIESMKKFLPFKLRRGGTSLYPRTKIYLLRTIECPVIIIETCFLTHPIDKLFILHPRSVDVIAEVLVDGVINYKMKKGL